MNSKPVMGTVPLQLTIILLYYTALLVNLPVHENLKTLCQNRNQETFREKKSNELACRFIIIAIGKKKIVYVPERIYGHCIESTALENIF